MERFFCRLSIQYIHTHTQRKPTGKEREAAAPAGISGTRGGLPDAAGGGRSRCRRSTRHPGHARGRRSASSRDVSGGGSPPPVLPNMFSKGLRGVAPTGVVRARGSASLREPPWGRAVTGVAEEQHTQGAVGDHMELELVGAVAGRGTPGASKGTPVGLGPAQNRRGRGGPPRPNQAAPSPPPPHAWCAAPSSPPSHPLAPAALGGAPIEPRQRTRSSGSVQAPRPSPMGAPPRKQKERARHANPPPTGA
jgi:hypothetical protein